MNNNKLILAILILTVAIAAMYYSPENKSLQDGYYTAEMAKFDDFGWKEYITIHVSNDKIITAEFDAKNASGFIKSWDMDYMRKMNFTDGTYPNKYTRSYEEALLSKQKADEVEAITGATHSYSTFQKLADAAIKQAKKGDKKVVFVEK